MSIDRRHFLIGLAGLGTSLVTSLVAGRAHADSVDDALAKVFEARKSIKTLQADFRQTRIIGLLASEVKSKGHLTLVSPNRLRWDLEPPDAVTYWIGPEGLAMANQDGVTKVGKAAAGRFASVLGDLLVMLGGDMRKLRKRYRLSVSEADGRFVLEAKPTQGSVKKHVSKLRLEAGKKLWQVSRIEIHEKSGDQSIIDFGPFSRDKPVKDSFIKPPKE
jgi:outer membrane lipoprotein-sorting protein